MINKAMIRKNEKIASRNARKARLAKKSKIKLLIRRLVALTILIILMWSIISVILHIKNWFCSKVNDLLDSKIQEATNQVEEQIITRDEMKEIVREVVKEEQANQITEEQVHSIVEQKISSRSLSTPREVKTSSTSRSLGSFKMTSYYDGDAYLSTNKTGSGKTTANFKVNEKGWYTYNGKIVLAAATNELKKSGYSKKGSQQPQDKHYFNYNDEVIVTIDGVDYDGIILDSCGAAMWKGEKRIDLFVSSSKSVVTKTVEVKLK